jgi:hypothetical protein
MSRADVVRVASVTLVLAALAMRIANSVLAPMLHGYDALGHLAYVFFLDLYRAVPHADQGWSYFHPPLHYALGWLLAQSGSAEALVRGLMAWNHVASLGVAALSAWMVARAFPERRGAPLLAFASLAFLPPHVYASGMPGNELTAALLSTAGFGFFVVREQQGRSSLRGDALTGVLLGAALLTKYNAAVPALAVAGTLALQGLGAGVAAPVVRRIATIALAALAVCGPYYARNVADFGTPFPLAGHRPVVDAFEAQQPPGERTLADLVHLSPRLFIDPDPRAPHMLHSIPGTLYAALWVHEDQEQSGLSLSKQRALLGLGLLPTALVAIGLLSSGARVLRRRADPIATSNALLALGGLSAMALFSFGTPTFAALKAMYLLNLSPAFAYGLVVAVGRVPTGSARASLGGAAALAVVLAGAAYARGLSLPATPETLQMAAVRGYFGEWEAARAVYEREWRALERGERREVPLNPLWLRGMRAGLELEAGRPREAARQYARSLAARLEQGVLNPFASNRAAVAFALTGDVTGARVLLDAALERADVPELRVNRAVLRAFVGDRAGAAEDLELALAASPELPAGLALAARLATLDAASNADTLRARAERAALRPPRGYPYGAGDGRGLNTQLYMLVWTDAGLARYRPARARP